jgi:hypothetical protein
MRFDVDSGAGRVWLSSLHRQVGEPPTVKLRQEHHADGAVMEGLTTKLYENVYRLPTAEGATTGSPNAWVKAMTARQPVQ